MEHTPRNRPFPAHFANLRTQNATRYARRMPKTARMADGSSDGVCKRCKHEFSDSDSDGSGDDTDTAWDKDVASAKKEWRKRRQATDRLREKEIQRARAAERLREKEIERARAPLSAERLWYMGLREQGRERLRKWKKEIWEREEREERKEREEREDDGGAADDDEIVDGGAADDDEIVDGPVREEREDHGGSNFIDLT